jgi:hypothetical protein
VNIGGIDPGMTGALVGLTPLGELFFKEPMPTNGGFIDIPRVADFFRKGPLKGCHVFLEHAQSFPKQGIAGTFSYGRGFGSLEGILGTLGVPYTLVRPNIWTKEMYAGLPKEMPPKEKALLTAQRIFPGLDLRANERCRVPHLGIVDGLMIAEYGRRKRG